MEILRDVNKVEAIRKILCFEGCHVVNNEGRSHYVVAGMVQSRDIDCRFGRSRYISVTMYRSRISRYTKKDD